MSKHTVIDIETLEPVEVEAVRTEIEIVRLPKTFYELQAEGARRNQQAAGFLQDLPAHHLPALGMGAGLIEAAEVAMAPEAYRRAFKITERKNTGKTGKDESLFTATHPDWVRYGVAMTAITKMGIDWSINSVVEGCVHNAKIVKLDLWC